MSDWMWALIKITATSAHPVRNSRNDLIPRGLHTLWEESNPNRDGDRGSFQPNVYAYDFRADLSRTPILEVTIEPFIINFPDNQAVLFGTIGGRRVFQSDPFQFRDKQNKKLRVFVKIPVTSANPFSWNAEVLWGVEEGKPPSSVPGIAVYSTILELYWVATTIHTAFQGGIPVDFLRRVLGRAPLGGSSPLYQDMTKKVFSDFNKRYDTAQGAIYPVTHIVGG